MSPEHWEDRSCHSEGRMHDDENGNFVQITIKTGEGQAKEILKSLESRGAPKVT